MIHISYNKFFILITLAFIACGQAAKNNADKNSHIRTEFSNYGDIQFCDSIFYNALSNDTIKKSFINTNGTWQLAQTFRERFNPEGQVIYSISERNNAEKPYKKEILYIYNQQRKLTEETEYECSPTSVCDSIFKTKYTYDTNGELQSKTFYIWQNSEWSEYTPRRSFPPNHPESAKRSNKPSGDVLP